MNMKRLGSLGIALVILLSITGCGKRGTEVTQEMYNDVKKELQTVQGMRVDEIEGAFINFVYKVFNPQTEEDMVQGVEGVKELFSEDTYNEMVGSLGEYDETKDTTVSEILVKYSIPENNNDEMARVYVEFNIRVGELGQKKAIEFVFNPSGKIFKYYIWNGEIKRAVE